MGLQVRRLVLVALGKRTAVNAKFFHSLCFVLEITNLYTSAYHPQTNGQVEQYNRTIAAMLPNYVGEHQDDCDV